MPIAQEMKNLTEDIAVSYGERMSWLADAMKDTHQMMGRIRKDHRAMAENLGAFLDGSESTRISNFKEMLSAIQTRQREREEEVAGIIEKSAKEMDMLAKEIKEKASELKGFLAESESQRLTEFQAFFSDVQKRTAEIQKQTTELIATTQKDLKQARSHWQNLAKVMASKRTEKRVPITKVPKEAKVAKKVEEAAEKALEEGELKVKLLDLVEGNPKGISLRQLGSKLGVHHIRLAKTIKELVDEGRVVKRDALYFPA